jgi:xeroderma pigmentosum group C-complementing protein
VYLRKHVQPVYRKDAWRRLGREVLPDQLGSPVKTTSRKLTMKKSRLTSAETPNTHVDIALFGEWQTRARVPPTIIDGIIPKNEHGNVCIVEHFLRVENLFFELLSGNIEVWHPCDIPIGSVHLRGNRIGMIASSLGVDYAPVVVGFQRNEAGFTVPVMDGIIIPQAMESEQAFCRSPLDNDFHNDCLSPVPDVVWEAYEAAEQASLERTLATRAARVAKRWRTLVRGLFLKKRLEDTYLPNRSHVLQSQLMEAAAMIAATQPKQ